MGNTIPARNNMDRRLIDSELADLIERDRLYRGASMDKTYDDDSKYAALAFATQQFLRTAEGKMIEPGVSQTLLAACGSDDEVFQRISRLQSAGFTLAPEYQCIDWSSVPRWIINHAQFTYAGALAQAKEISQQLNEAHRPYLDRKTWWAQLRIEGELPAEAIMALTEASMKIQTVANKAVLLAHVIFDPESLSPEAVVDLWDTAVESAGTDDAVDDQTLLKEAGLTLWKPVQHMSIAELDEHLNKLSNDLYYSAVERVQAKQDELADCVRTSAPGFSM